MTSPVETGLPVRAGIARTQTGMEAGVSGRGAPALQGDRLVLRVRRVEGPPVVAVRVCLWGGARLESVPGLALLTGRLLAEGSRRRDWRQVTEEAEARGMVLAGYGTFESHGLSVDALAEDWETALAWAAELTLEPAFSEDRLHWLRRQMVAELASLADLPDVRTTWAFLEQLYAPHPRGRPLQGDPASLDRLTSEDCHQFHRQALAGRVLVTVAGAVDPEAVEPRVRELFIREVPLAQVAPAPPAPKGLDLPRREVIHPGADQAHLYLGHLTLPRPHPDYEALEVLGVILGAGSGLAGRIPTRVREREALAYSAHAQAVAGAGLDPGRLVVHVGTAPPEVFRAEAAVREEISRLLEEGVESWEVEDARTYLLGREPFRRETARQWADLLVEAEFYGLPLESLEWRREVLSPIDRTRVEAAARRYLNPAKLKVTVGLPG